MGALRTFVAASIALPLALGWGAAALAQNKAPASDVDPDALAALNKMGDALRGMGAFTLTAEVTNDVVLDDGQKLQTPGAVKITARRPDKFRIQTDSDHQDRELIYDGQSLTVFAPRIGYYASVPTPPTIRATLDAAKDKYGIELPLADLFSLGTDPALTARIQSGFYVGPETISGVACDHYAFRQKIVDWEVWIRSDGPALPCRMVITSTDDPAMPQYAATLHWEAGSPTADTFTFVPPEGAHRITVAEASTAKAK